MGTLCSLPFRYPKKRSEALLASTKDAEETASFVVESATEEHAQDAPAVAASQTLHATYEADTAPVNLPIAAEAIVPVGYAAVATPIEQPTAAPAEQSETQVLELRAHSQHALISSDALRLIVRECKAQEEQETTLDTLIEKARHTYPSEDGWVILTVERIEQLMSAKNETELPVDDTVGAGSLAEAIALGDIGAAYMLIGRRPMIALADASADFDALYRKRQGTEASVSDLLVSLMGSKSDDEVIAVVKTLTSALDGTYSTESDAVKVAIMKAVRLLS